MAPLATTIHPKKNLFKTETPQTNNKLKERYITPRKEQN